MITQEKIIERYKKYNFEVIEKYTNSSVRILAKCHCGREFNSLPASVFAGRVKSCGCLRNWKGHGDISGTYFNHIKSGANKREIEFNLTLEYLWKLYINQDGKCAISGIEISFPSRVYHRKDINFLTNQTASLDRIKNNIGYLEGNVQWVHKDVNYLKGDFVEAEFINYCHTISHFHKDKSSKIALKEYHAKRSKN